MFQRNTYLLRILLLSAVISGFYGCTARRLGPDQKLIKKVFIICEDPQIDKDDMYGYVKQKPNRKLLGINTNIFRLRKESTWLKNGAGYPLYLCLHNLVNPEREKKRQDRRDRKFEERNDKRKSKHKDPLKKKRKTFGEIMYSIGEEPSILDTNSTLRTTAQLKQYLNNKGYFNGEVKDSMVYAGLIRKPVEKNKYAVTKSGLFGREKRKVIVYYYIKPSQPYRIRNVDWNIEDPGIAYDLGPDTAGTLLVSGANYDTDKFEAERGRIVTVLRNNGYYGFTKDFIRFTVDSTVGDHQVDVKVTLLQKQYKTSDTTWKKENHNRYYVNNIVVKTIYSTYQLKSDTAVYDTVLYDGVHILRNKNKEEVLRYKEEVIADRIALRPGQVYSQALTENTYNQLTALRLFRQVIIDAVPAGNGQVDLRLTLFAIPKQNYAAQMEGTNTGGFLGIGGSASYQNNNVFRGAELLEFRLKGGIEAQQPFNSQNQQGGIDQITFNTIEAGTDVSLNIPRAFFPFNKLPVLRKAEGRRTTISSTFSYQRRIDYDRVLGNLSTGYTCRLGKYTRVGIYPFELNVVKVNPRQGLLDLLANGDPLLTYRFTDHLINDFRISAVYNGQANKKPKWKPYLKVDAECSGIMVRKFMEQTNFEVDDLGSYRIAGIPFSHYVRFFVDGRIYRNIGDHQQIVIRVAHGIGFPQKNFRTLPLEKSFYAGGSNGIRAWEARSLGPGSFPVPADQRFAQFGEVQAEYNIELRFRISKTLYGALFADGGNIWLLPSAAADDNAEFDFAHFLNDLAFGPGVGLRYDLSFFIIRFDYAVKMRDPAQPYGERWWVPGLRRLPGNLNFGIGYPF